MSSAEMISQLEVLFIRHSDRFVVKFKLAHSVFVELSIQNGNHNDGIFLVSAKYDEIQVENTQTFASLRRVRPFRSNSISFRIELIEIRAS